MIRRAALFVCFATSALGQVVPWAAETTSIPSAQAGDLAIVTTNGGLLVGTDTAQVGAYGWVPLNGQLAQVVPLGALKSADARGPFLFVTSQNSALFAFFDGDAGLEQLNPPSFSILSAGFVALRAKGGNDFMLAVTRTASVQRWDVHIEDGGVSFMPIDQVALPQVPGGIVADDRTGNLFITQPTRGVLLLGPPTGGAAMPIFVASIDAGQLGANIGGVALLPLRDGGVWVLTANPASTTIVAHELNQTSATLDFVGAAAIGAPDGGAARAALPGHLDTTLSALPGFPKGLLAVHDGVLANYKLVSLEALDDVIPLPELAWDAAVDGGDVDAGLGDGGAGDGGAPDGGRRDGGLIIGGGVSGPGQGIEPMPQCSCGSPLLLFLPALLLLWWIRRPASRRPESPPP